jgi:cellulose synthase/poly-beta-1,6-N-acetylglucosamine synthase-like glycosyltransferase
MSFLIHQVGHPGLPAALIAIFVLSQPLYTFTLLVQAYFLRLPVDWVNMNEPIQEPEHEWPYIVLFYPVLQELEATMRTTFLSLSKLDYPAERCSIIAIPNAHDTETIASLNRLAAEFAFLKILVVPPTSDPLWQIVWDSWDANPQAYWWHQGKRAGIKDLPPKKTRQLIYALYHTANALKQERNLVINYVDADSCPPVDHFKGAVIGLKHYDVLQALNVAGNLNDTMAASLHAFDHMAWDGFTYPHLSAHGRQPYWMLGKGLFYKAADLIALGGFHPWITIEDPEIGLRYHANGKRLGILADSLIEEVPKTWLEGITQRKRWVCGFFQSLSQPLRYLGLTPWERFKCWLIFVPCLMLWVNAVGLPVGIWSLVTYAEHHSVLPVWTIWLSAINLALFAGLLLLLYVNTWCRTGFVLSRRRDRIWYMFRVNPAVLIIWWFLWIVPLTIGFWMYVRDQGLAWQRTEKVDANRTLVRSKLRIAAPSTDIAMENRDRSPILNRNKEMSID